MKKLGAILTLAMLSCGSCSAISQTLVRISYPTCTLAITTDNSGVALSDRDLVATSRAPWKPDDGCAEMFSLALPAPAFRSQPPSPERAAPEQASAKAEFDSLQDINEAIREQEAMIVLLETAIHRAEGRPNPALDLREPTRPEAPALVSVVVDRIRTLQQTINRITAAALTQDQANGDELEALQKRGESLERKALLAVERVKQLELDRKKVREEREMLNNWLLATIFAASIVGATALLTMIALALTRRTIFTKARPDSLGTDRRWVRDTLEEHQWILRFTRFVPYAIAAAMVLSAVGVLVNVLTSGETVIEPLKGGALFATLVALIGIAKAAGGWRSTMQREILDLLRADADLAKTP